MSERSEINVIVADVTAKKRSAREIAETAIAETHKRDGDYGAFLSVNEELTLSFADSVDARVKAGENLPLAGVPVAIKDNLALTSTRTTCGSKILENWIAPYTATAVERIIAAGGVPFGKTNLDEFAMGSSCENSALGVTRNPWHLERVPGGSSGGSAAAVAGRLTPVSLGSDTGGSIREPAAFCGIVGFKPTYGRVSRYGLIAFASSLDQIGPFGRSVRDVAAVYDAIGGKDPRDATSSDHAFETTSGLSRKDLRGVRVGIVREFGLDALEAPARAVYEAAYHELEKLGAELVEVTLPTAKYGLSTYYLIAPAEASSNLARFDGIRYGLRVDGNDVGDLYEKTRAAGFGPEVKRRILIGTHALSSGYYDAYYVKAQKARTLIAADFAKAFASCDVIASPAASTTAFAFNAKKDPYSMYLMDYYTIPVSLAGLPSLSQPCGFVPDAIDGHPMPLGLQLAAPLFEERRLLEIAAVYEDATAHIRTPEYSAKASV